MKIGLLKRKLITVYSLGVILTCLLVGCLRQPGEVISHSEKSTKDALVASKSSSSFNYFDSKKKYTPTQSDRDGKVSQSSPVIQQVGNEEEKPGRVTILGDSVTDFENSVENSQKNLGTADRKKIESWRSKSLISAAKKYPSKVAKTYHQKSDQIKVASSSMAQGISNGIKQISQSVSTSKEKIKTEKIKANSTPSVPDQFRTDELSRYYDQTTHRKAFPEVSQLENDLKRKLEHTKPIFADINSEMRRLQISDIMERAKQELQQENYEYALFLAEQARESSSRGQVVFRPDEETPQGLLKHIKSVQAGAEVKPVEHKEYSRENSGIQPGKNSQFRPSTVHPLKRRYVAPSTQRKTQSENSADSIQELPLITPRNWRKQQQRKSVRPQKSITQEFNKKSPSVSLEPPSFELQNEKPSEFTATENDQPQENNTIPQLDLKPSLEESSEEPPAKVRISGPESLPQESEEKVEKATSSGPKLMLPKLPSKSQDLTSKTVRAQTTPVKFQSKKQEISEEKKIPLVENAPAEAKEAETGINSSLILDEIQWELEEKQDPQAKSSLWGVSTVLLLVGGVIILLLLAIIVLLLKRVNSPS